jgi:hypothetical protein
MTNQSILEPLVRKDIKAPPDELAQDIEAKPLSMPEFTCDIQGYLVNQQLAARWIFTDRRRYAQAKAQGFRNCTKQDLKPGFATLNPFEEEGGTKYINGDLILMVIDRKRYLGALRYKHEVADALSNPAVQRTLSARKAVQDMGETVAAVNRQRMASGREPVMSVFTPGAADLSQTNLNAKEIGRIGSATGVDMFTGKDAPKEGK